MKIRIRTVVILILVAICSVWLVFPVEYLFTISIQNLVDIVHVPPYFIPPRPTFRWYEKILVSTERIGLRTALLNSAIIASGTTFITVILGSLSAYAFSRFNFRLKGKLFFFLLASQMIPPAATIVPLYIIYNHIGIIDTHIGMILVLCSMLVPYVTWLMKGFFDGLPVELEEAAMMDGCSRLEALFRIIFPVAAPGIAACAVFSFIESWNEFFMGYILTSRNATTIQVAIGTMMGHATWDFGTIFASGIVTILPVLIFGIVFRKYLLKGLTAGGLKY